MENQMDNMKWRLAVTFSVSHRGYKSIKSMNVSECIVHLKTLPEDPKVCFNNLHQGFQSTELRAGC